MHRFAAAVLAAVALNLSSCGNPERSLSSGEPVSPPATQPQPPPQPAPNPIPAPGSTSWKPVWGDLATAKLRPGSRLSSNDCTVGFLYVDPVQHLYYLGTAAHCTNSADGTSEDGTGTRIVLEDPESGLPFGEIGTVVLDSDSYSPVLNNGDVDESMDFSLILLDPGINLMANPQMFTFEGPTGWVLCPTLAAGDAIGIYGHGQVFNVTNTLKSREGALLRCNSGNAVIGIPIDGGDSGGPVLHSGSGKALGHATNGLGALMIATTMDFVFSDLAKQGFGNVALATIDGGYVGPGVP